MSSSPVALGSVLRLPRGPRASALTLPRLLALGLPADISSSVSVHSSPPSPRVFSPSCLFHVPVRAPPSESTFEPLLCPGAQRCRLPVPSPRVLPTPPPPLVSYSHLPIFLSISLPFPLNSLPFPVFLPPLNHFSVTLSFYAVEILKGSGTKLITLLFYKMQTLMNYLLFVFIFLLF